MSISWILHYTHIVHKIILQLVKKKRKKEENKGEKFFKKSRNDQSVKTI